MNPIEQGFGFDEVPSAHSEADKLEKLLNDARLDYSQPLEAPQIALEIGGEIFGTLGNFSMIYGKAKSRKSFLATLLMAAAASNEPTGAIGGKLPADKRKVVLVDTEQGTYHVTKAAQRVCRLLNKPFDGNPNFEVYALRRYSTAERLQIIEGIINQTPDLGLLIIDGIRDVITSINDEAEATKINDLLLYWTETYNIHIITVLHQNKGNNQARGHIGSEIVNKAETSITVEIDEKGKEVSIVEPGYSRNKAFETFAFMVNDEGLPEIVSDWQPKVERKAGHYKTDPSELTDIKHGEIIRCIKGNTDKPKNSELIEQIKYAVNKATGEPIGSTKAKEFKIWYLNEGWIKHNGKERSAKAYYSFNLYPQK